jgi:hypothetical protein
MIRAGTTPATHPGAIVAQYETLRSVMLGQALPPEARSGLIVLLRQGMWRCACRPAAATARPEPFADQTSIPMEPFERRAIVYALAGLAMARNDRRTS